jgi:hypothetical protein
MHLAGSGLLSIEANAIFFVMAGLVPAIHVFFLADR